MVSFDPNQYSDIEKIFGRDSSRYIALAQALRSEMVAKKPIFPFVSMEDFYKVATDPGESGRIYWLEILYRAHVAAVSSFLRSADWVDGTIGSFENGNYLSFCANLRGLLEATADTLHGLSGVSKTLSENHRIIELALSGCSNQFVTSEELEDQLIHFIYARKVDKKNGLSPLSHNAKSAREYLDLFKRLKLSGADELYSELCQVVHPAMASLELYISSEYGESLDIKLIDGKEACENLISLNTELFNSIFRYAFNTQLILLRVLSYFDLAEVEVDVVRNLNMESMDGWKSCENLLHSS